MSEELKIAVMPRSSFSYFWKSFYAGVRQAERDLRASNPRITVQCDAPARDDDYEMQIEIYKKATRQGVDGMVLAPCHCRMLVAPVEAAAGMKIPTVVVDSNLETARTVSFVGTNNNAAGTLAAQRMGQQLKGKGAVLILHHQKGSRNTEEREQGFTRHLRQLYPEVEILPTEEYAGATRDSARLASARLLAQFAGRFQGIFTPNETSTAGMLMALQGTRLPGTVLIGFDYSDIYISSVRSGGIQGLVLQKPFRIGELGVKTLVDHLQGKRVPPIVDTGATLLTPENMDTPEIQAFLNLQTGALAKLKGTGAPA